MKIKSQFKDYYDYVAHLYGGGDPSILYLRNRLAPLRQACGLLYPSEIIVPHAGARVHPQNYDYMRYRENGPSYHFKWLAVCGKYYLLVARYEFGAIESGPWRILNEDEHPKLWDRLTTVHRFTETKDASYWIGSFEDNLVELSRKVNAPVFTFYLYQNHDTVLVEGEIPILADLDFQRFYSPEQLYQEMSYFLSNIIKESPDVAPPSTMTDKEKILQHGFDIKQSFRHRK